MRFRSVMLCLAAFTLLSASCARSPEPASQGAGDTTSAAVPDTSARATVLVDALPAGVEGVELAENGLRVLKGYQFERDSDTTFVLRRLSDGRGIKVGGCGCVGAGCVPFLTDDGIIICVSVLCNGCGLAVTSQGTTIDVVRYEKP